MSRTAFVSGSTTGIGKAIGIRLLEAGYDVIFNYSNNDSKADTLKSELGKYKGKYHIIKHDMSDMSCIETLKQKITDFRKNIDVMVFNAGSTRRNEFGNISEEDWDFLFNVNVKVPFFTLQAMDKMLNNDGRIILIGSILGNVPHAVGIPYGVSKAGMHMLAKYLVKVFAERGITVNAIAPGFTDTDWQKSKSPELRQKIETKIAMHRFAEPDEIAGACMSIIDNQYINGQVITVDGGYDYR